MHSNKIVYYWSPFLTKIATEKAVINSAKSMVKYSKEFKPKIISTLGEYDSYINEKELFIRLKTNIKKKFLPHKGFFKSRFSFLIIFIFSFFPLYNLLKRNKPDFFIIHLLSSLPLIVLLLFSFKTKFILRISGFPKLTILRKLLWKIVSKKLHKITCPTIETLEYLRNNNLFENNKLVLLRDPIINTQENIKKKHNSDDFELKGKNDFFLSIGRLTKQKNFAFLINNFFHLVKKNDSLKLIILGEGEKKKELEKLILDKKLQNHVFLLGYKRNILPYLKKSKAFILSSLWEDPGFVLVEAIYNNCNIISSNCKSGPKEILDNGNNGFLFKSNSNKSFIEVFENFTKQTESDLIIKRKKAKKYIKDFSFFRHYKKLEEILN